MEQGSYCAPAEHVKREGHVMWAVEGKEKEAGSVKKPSAPTHHESAYLSLSVKETINVLRVGICSLDSVTCKELLPLNTKEIHIALLIFCKACVF